MLTKDELKYLETIPESRLVTIQQYNPVTKDVVKSIIEKIKVALPEAKIIFMGASALEIAGQNDIDLYLLTEPSNFEDYSNEIIKLFGEPTHKAQSFIEWNFDQDGFDIELYISDPTTESMQRQLKIFNILSNNSNLRQEYENLKLKFNRKKYKDYQRAKYEFYNEILNDTKT